MAEPGRTGGSQPGERIDPTDAHEKLLRAIQRWENLPHNKPGSDKTWVELLLNASREHYESATKAR